ncbi:MAG: SPASM domain-containing protein [Candidatus Cloacimonetes bacterium]|nr:SPASM domain-containing protein [Candidatus Cloacimonadota bacterium]
MGLPVFLSRPPVLQLELTNACNLSCASCGHSYWNKSKNRPRYFPIERLDSLLPFIEYASEVHLGGYGEPMLHPELKYILSWIRSRGENLKLKMISNITLLQKQWESLKELNLLVISMDGVGEIYQKNRHTDFLNIENGLDFLSQKIESGHALQLEVNLVWNRETHQNLEKTLEFLQRYPVKVLNLLPEKMYSKNRFVLGLLKPNHLHKVISELHALKRGTGIQINHPDLLKFPLECNQPLDSLFVLSDGEVMACCASIFKGNEFRFSLGQLFDSKNSFYDLYNSLKMRMFRRSRLQNAPYESPCNDCGFRLVTDTNLRRELHGQSGR